MGLGSYLRGRAQGNMLPSQGRSALVASLLQQSMRPSGSMSPVESLDIASKPILAALLAKQEDKARTTQSRALAGALSRTQQPGAQGEAARRAATIIAGGSPDNPLAQQILGQQAQNAFAPLGGEGFTLSPGQTRYDAGGAPIATAAATPEPGKIPELINEITDDLYKESSQFLEQRSAIGRIQQAASDPSAAGDMAVVFAYMKMLDPTSSVRETEYANAENARGVPASVRNIWNRIQNGMILETDQRADFVDRAQRLFRQAAADQKERNQRYLVRATNAGVPQDMFQAMLLPTAPAALPQSSVVAPSSQPAPTPAGPPRRVIP